MKISLFYNGLLLTFLPFSTNCTSLHPTLSAAQAQTKEAALSTTPKNRRQIPGWQFDDLALLKAIKDNPTRLWHHHSNKKIFQLENLRE